MINFTVAHIYVSKIMATIKALRNWKISIKAYQNNYRNFNNYISFDNKKQFDYNKNRQNIIKIGRNNEF